MKWFAMLFGLAVPLAVLACPPPKVVLVKVVPLYSVTYSPITPVRPAPESVAGVPTGPIRDAALIAVKCGTCHAGPATDGGGVVLIDGERFVGDARLRRRSLARLNAGTMPPARDASGVAVPALSDGERRSLADFLSGSP